MTLDSIEYRLGEISGQLELLLKQLPSLNRRVASLESFKWRLVGGTSVLVTAVEWFFHGRR